MICLLIYCLRQLSLIWLFFCFLSYSRVRINIYIQIQIQQSQGMKYVASQIASSDGSLANKGNIDWNDFNYPICCKIYHFNADETPQIHRKRVFLLRLNHWIIILAVILNLITNIINTVQGVPDAGVRIGISVFLFLFWTPLSFLLFFYPYHIIMKDEGRPIIFYVLSAITILFFAIWCIADFADANGFIMVQKNFAADRGAAGAFGIVTAILMLFIAILSTVNCVMFARR